MMTRTSRRAATAVVFVTILWAGLAPVAAQQQQWGALLGEVTDREGGRVASAVVTVTSADGLVERQVVGDAEGRFRVLYLPPGEYAAKVDLAGFDTVRYPAFEIRPDRVTTIGVTLGVSAGIDPAPTVEVPLLAGRDEASLSTRDLNFSFDSARGSNHPRIRASTYHRPPGEGWPLAIYVAGAPIDRLELGLSKKQRRGFHCEWISEDWTYDADTGTATGPPTDPFTLRLDAALQGLVPERIDLEASLDGRTVFDGKVEVEKRPAVDASRITPYMGLTDVVVPGERFGIHLPEGVDARIEVDWGVVPVDDQQQKPAGPGQEAEVEVTKTWLEYDYRPPEPKAAVDASGTPYVGIVPYGKLTPPFTVRGVDRWDETVFSYEWHPVVVPAGLCSGGPMITGVSDLNFAGQQLCVCGCFEELEPGDEVQIGDHLLGPPVGRSPYVATFVTPKELAPGPYEVGWAPGAGGAGGPFPTEVIEVQARIDDEVIQKGGTTALEMAIVGSERALPVELRNRNPGKIAMSPSNSIRTESTGGPAANTVPGITVTGLERGTYMIDWRLDAGSCPCSGILPKIGAMFERELHWIYSSLIDGRLRDRDADSDSDTDTDSDTDSDSDEEAAPWPAVTDCPGLFGLVDDRFRVEIDPAGRCRELDGTSALYAAPGATEWQMLLTMVNACDVNAHYWLFVAALTDVEYFLEVLDTESGQTKSYTNPVRRPIPAIIDTHAFATCR